MRHKGRTRRRFYFLRSSLSLLGRIRIRTLKEGRSPS
jgi:hypothetical protein